MGRGRLSFEGAHPGTESVRPAYGTPTSRASLITGGNYSSTAGAPSSQAIVASQRPGGTHHASCPSDLLWYRRASGTADCVFAPDGQVTQEVREFPTTYTALLAMLDWLVEVHCPVVAMESTGVY
jgi:hypothetical protein